MIATLLTLCFVVAPQDDPLPAADPAINAAELRHHVAFLASDELQGRRIATPEAHRAARYLAKALERAGLEPAGDDGTFLQAVPLVRVKQDAAPELVLTDVDGERVDAAWGVDFSVATRGLPSPTDALTVRVVRSLDDLPEEPDRSIALLFDASRSEREEWLAARGWDDSGAFGLELTVGSSRPGRGPRGGVGSERLSTRPEPSEGGDPCDTVRLLGDLGERFLLDEVATVALKTNASVTDAVDYNVVGRISGVPREDGDAARALAREAIVFSAHYDHIGTRSGSSDGGHGGEHAGDESDTIFNGADDDASGVAGVLELAEAYAAGAPPARTLIFLLAGGEEVGLIGTRYYIAHPAVPLADTVTNLNFEMIGRPDDLAGGAGKLWLTGFERSTLGEAFRAAGLDVIQDPRPDQNFFQRSDNYAFALEGIVAQTLSSYDLHEDYHNVTDEVDTLDFEHMEAAMRASYAASRLLADGTLAPEWLPGGRPERRR